MEPGYYTSGQFARKANVTIRTIRFYDKQGILKPSKVSEAGYRLYTDEDFGRLQKILSLKYLGFSLEEIMAMTINDDVEDIAYSLELQKELIRKRIRHLQMMEQTLQDTARMVEASGQVDWNDILNLIHITNMEHAIVEQYKTAVNLNVRIALHQRFSHNPVPWFSWLASRIPFRDGGCYLEVGCGNGELWQYVNWEDADVNWCQCEVVDGCTGGSERMQQETGLVGSEGGLEKIARIEGVARAEDIDRAEGGGLESNGKVMANEADKGAVGTSMEIHITDVSAGMVEDAARLLKKAGVMKRAEGNSLVFETEDCQKLSYEDGKFDAVVANHVLFYVKNISQALGEISRVLKPDGEFYCSTYGRGHMKEITSLVQEFDPRISLSEVALYELFGLENGEVMLEKHFSSVEKVMYEDYLLVDEAEPLLDYILSCHGNQSEMLSQRQLEFKGFLQKKIEEKGGIRITKDAGVFVCRGKW